MLALTLVPVAFGVFGFVYGALALLLGAIFMVYAVRLRRDPVRERAVSLFHYSMLYLALLFVATAIDAVIRDDSPSGASAPLADISPKGAVSSNARRSRRRVSTW